MSKIKEKANRFIIQSLADAGIKDLAPSHGDIIIALFRNDYLPMKEIARIIDRDKSTVTPLVNKLIELDYIKKQTDDKDNRVCNISITQKGLELKPVFMKISQELLSRVYKNFTEEEQSNAISLLEKINSNL